MIFLEFIQLQFYTQLQKKRLAMHLQAQHFAKTIFPFFLFLITPFFVCAQGGKITGTVLSGEDDKPIDGVSVEVKGKGIGTSTNTKGLFSILVYPGDKIYVPRRLW